MGNVDNIEERADILETQASELEKRATKAGGVEAAKTDSKDAKRIGELTADLLKMKKKMEETNARLDSAQAKQDALVAQLEETEDSLSQSRSGGDNNAELEAEQAERKNKDLKRKIKVLEAELEAETQKTAASKKELDSIVAELLG
ncbi:hypothetical protein SARC_13082 [Sphaeroforma arctica JP610]|uniref:Tropomyosin n=1 Tax=Sphaeroforma arctica JP610 TaxID=667725 RepID=A0A0L0FC78_9EUKA|nr:hypothetical protein SARC_13082 [Sphaeroforma arctica JP610]KNC74370.1 hypothetical protein SARC_13082 [Sphaeroforma arctica JP610]|eukprot:XP_014148272.1 hypothetical protein SARC_13082 [Sphaeroforma arctica JP610]